MKDMYKRIMVTVDGSPFSLQALPHAESLVQLYNAEMVIFQAIPDEESISEMLSGSRAVQKYEGRVEHHIDDAKKALEELALQEMKSNHIQPTVVIEVGKPADKILDYASHNEIDMIIMTTHGRSGLGRWVYGSVADRVLRHAPCPVFLIRAGDE